MLKKLPPDVNFDTVSILRQLASTEKPARRDDIIAKFNIKKLSGKVI
jgi:hypothetical protein